MIERATQRRLIGQSVYAGLVLLLLFLRLLPLHPGRTGWPGPELTLALTFAWVLRRPEQVPVLLIAAAFLLQDIMLLWPFGLWAAVVVMATEAARLREVRWREQPFVVEWLRVSLLIAAMMLGYRIVLGLFLLPMPPLGQVVLSWLATAAAYPLVVLAGHWLLGLRRATPAEAER